MATSYLDLNGLKHLWERVEESFSPIDTKAKDIYAEGIEKTTETGNPVEVETSFAQNASALSVALEPIQDLNGYDKVWSGGNGKNLLPMTVSRIKASNSDKTWTNNSCVISDVTFTVNTNSVGSVISITANGTASANAALWIIPTSEALSFPSDVILNGTPDGATIDTYYFGGQNIGRQVGNIPFAANTAFSVALCVRSGVTANNVIFKPMIRLATETDSIFEPYSNICPIYPGNGKNLLEPHIITTENISSILNADGSLTFTGNTNGVTRLPIINNSLKLAAGAYVFSGVTNGSLSTFGMRIRNHAQNDIIYAELTSGEATFTLAEETIVDVLARFVDPQTNINVTFYPMIRLASISDPTFVPYQRTKIERTGKNLFKTTATTQTVNGVTFTVNSDGTVSVNGTSTAQAAITLGTVTLNAGTYTVSGSPSGSANDKYFLNIEPSDTMHPQQNQNILGGDYTFSDTAATNHTIKLYVCNNQTVNNVIFKPQIEYGSSATAYEPYDSSTLILNLGRDVYGGTVDVVKGTLTVNMAMVDLGDLTWQKTQGNKSSVVRFGTTIDNPKTIDSSYDKPNIVCSAYETITANQGYLGTKDGITIANSNGRLFVNDSSKNDLSGSDFKTIVSGIQFCYELATPQTYTLTPQQLDLLKGYNRISGDGIITIGYNATSDSTIQNELSEHEEELRNINQSISSLTSYDIVADGSGETTISGNEINISDAIGGNVISLTANITMGQITEEAETVSCGSGTCIITPLEDSYSSVDIIVKNGVNQTKNTVALGTAIGGGVVDITNGVGTETYKYYSLTAFSNKGAATTVDAYYINTYFSADINLQNQCLCNIGTFNPSRLTDTSITSPVYGFMDSYPSLFFVAFPKSFELSTIELANDFLVSIGGVKFTFPLATHRSFTLVPRNISLFTGNNVITGGRGTELLELTYNSATSSNVQTELNKQNVLLNNIINDIAPVEKSIAIENHSVGDYIILNGKFCKVTTAIATGEIITIGANVTQTTISAEILAILS